MMKYKAIYVLNGSVKKPMTYLKPGDVIELVNAKGFTFTVTTKPFKWGNEWFCATDVMGYIKPAELERV